MVRSSNGNAVSECLGVVERIFDREDLSLEEMPMHMRMRIERLSRYFPDLDLNQPLPEVRADLCKLVIDEFTVLDDLTEAPAKSVAKLHRDFLKIERFLPFSSVLEKEFGAKKFRATRLGWNVADVMGLSSELTRDQIIEINLRVCDLLTMSNEERLNYYKGRVNKFPESKHALGAALITLEASRYLSTEVGDFYIGGITALIEAENKYSNKNISVLKSLYLVGSEMKYAERRI